MPVIGVDTSGHVGAPPIWVVATRWSKTSRQRHRALYLSDEEHSQYEDYIENWAEKLSAVLFFRAIVGIGNVPGIYFLGDTIQIDRDFQGSRRDRVLGYLKRLFLREFQGQYPLSNPTILFNSVRESEDVKMADYKCTKARHGEIQAITLEDDLFGDLSVLPRTL